MSKKSGVSINFDPKKVAKNMTDYVKKNKKNMSFNGKCPKCNKKVTFKFSKGKANCPKCGFELDQS